MDSYFVFIKSKNVSNKKKIKNSNYYYYNISNKYSTDGS